VSGARVRGVVAAATLFAAFAMLASCTVGVGGGGYYGDGYAGVGYVGDYYEPYGYDYGGWGGRYHVGPPPGGGHGHDGGGHPDRGGRPVGGGNPGGGGHGGGGGHPAPSIPGRPR
jgi:hypothetical protein